MDLNTPNLDLPYIAPGQAQKHVTHNEAIRRLDAVIQLVASEITNTPPLAPEHGLRVIVGDDPANEFVGHNQKIAAWQDDAWAYYTPKAGWTTFNQSDQKTYRFDGQIWKAVEISLNPVDLVGVNATSDENNRLSVKSPATLFDHDGSGHQLKINKSETDQTASVLFQNNYAGYAEVGLTGDNNLHVKVSHDGSIFKDALIIDQDAAHVNFPNGIDPRQLAPTTPDCGAPARSIVPRT